jgi:hypothetical protein
MSGFSSLGKKQGLANQKSKYHACCERVQGIDNPILKVYILTAKGTG